MIQTLARKRTHATALAVLLALAVALFAVIDPASAARTLKVTSDSDGIVKAGTPVTLTYTSDTGETGDVTFTAPKGQEVFFTVGTGEAATSSRVVTSTLAGSPLVATATLQTTGAADGVYTITAKNGANPAVTVDVTVGDPGMDVGSGSIALGYTTPADGNVAIATTDGAAMVKDNAAASSPILLVLTVNNTLGNKTNDAGVSTITVVAPGGLLSAAGAPPAVGTAVPTADQAGSQTFTGDANALATITFSATKAEPGSLDVWAIIVGADGSDATSSRITLAFSGDPKTLNLGDPSGSLDDGDEDDRTDDPANVDGAGVYFDVSGVDSGGTPSALDQTVAAKTIAAVVSKAPEGGSTANITLALEPGTSAATTAALGAVRVWVHVTDDAAPKAGDYTVDVTLGGVSATKMSATITVVGDADSVEVTSDMSELSFGDVVTFTATVMDKNGNLVANSSKADDATDGVAFTWAGSLSAVSLDGTGATSGNVPIVKGQASARFVVTGDSGSAVVIATSGGKRGTTSVNAAGSDAPDAAGPSLGDFGNRGSTGLTSYNGPDASASELLALLAGRANAIWLSSGDSWVLYTSVPGVPNSVDFTVTSGNVVYISN